jgi:hypothetical protein
MTIFHSASLTSFLRENCKYIATRWTKKTEENDRLLRFAIEGAISSPDERTSGDATADSPTAV